MRADIEYIYISQKFTINGVFGCFITFGIFFMYRDSGFGV